jgi:hypothetical protein
MNVWCRQFLASKQIGPSIQKIKGYRASDNITNRRNALSYLKTIFIAAITPESIMALAMISVASLLRSSHIALGQSLE